MDIINLLLLIPKFLFNDKLKWLNKKVERTQLVVSLCEELGVNVLDTSFDSIYSHALVEYGIEYPNKEIFLTFFALDQTREYIKQHLYKKSAEELHNQLSGLLHTGSGEVFLQLKTEDVQGQEIIAEYDVFTSFIEKYEQKSRSGNLPLAKTSEEVTEIKKLVEQLYAEKSKIEQSLSNLNEIDLVNRLEGVEKEMRDNSLFMKLLIERLDELNVSESVVSQVAEKIYNFESVNNASFNAQGDQIFNIKVENLINPTHILEIENKINDIERFHKKFEIDVKINSKKLFNDSTIPPLSSRISKRTKVVKHILESFKKYNWIAINGGVLTGKSQLAVLVTENISREKIWINLREIDPSNLLLEIYQVLSSFLSTPTNLDVKSWQLNIIEAIKEPLLVVFDDLPKIDYKDASFKHLISFIQNCSKKKVIFLSTSNYELSREFKDFFDNNFFNDFTDLKFNKSEIKEIMLTYNPSENEVNKFVNIIHSISSGNPIIVKTICEFLSKKDWIFTDKNLEDIFRNNYSLELDINTQEILSKTVADESTKKLLYRLNIINGFFAIDEVRVISENHPLIENCVEKFYSAIGLWIQKIDETAFTISPLLKRLKTHNLSTKLEQKINYSLAQYILSKKTLTPSEAFKVILYFLGAKLYNEAGYIFLLVLNEVIEDDDIYFKSVFNIYWYSITLPTEMDLPLQLQIRILQIHINKKNNKEISFLINDLESITSIASKKGIDVSSAYILLGLHYFSTDLSKSINFLKKGSKGYMELIKNIIKPEHSSYQAELNKGDLGGIIWFLVFSVNSIEDIDNWFETIFKLTDKQLLSVKNSESSDSASVLIFRNIKEKEEGKEISSRNWNTVIDIFQLIQKKAKAADFQLMYANSIKYIIQVYAEKLNDINSAYEYAQNYLSEMTDHSTAQFLIQDEIGRQLFYHKRVNEATPLILEIVDKEVDKMYVEKLDTFLVASQIVGEKDTVTALSYSIKAQVFAIENEYISDVLRSKVLGELAISLFLNGNIEEAVYELEKGYQILLDSYNLNTEHHITIIRYGHVFNYIFTLVETGKPPLRDIEGQDYIPPRRGMFISTFEKEVLEKHFFEEKRFLVPFHFFRYFEMLKDYYLAKKWALNSITVQESFISNYLVIMNIHLVPYLITDEFYTKSVELQIKTLEETKNIYFNKNINTLSENNLLIKTLINKNLVNATKDTILQMGDKYDDGILFRHVLIPMVLHYLTIHSYDANSINNKTQLITDAIKIMELKALDINFIDSIKKMLFNEYVDNDVAQIILQNIKEYEGYFKNELKVIGYLCISYYSSDVEALRFQLHVINWLNTYIKMLSKGSYYFILIPFFENFWFNRIQNNKSYDLEFWERKSKPYYESRNIDEKVKCLFNIVVHHLDYPTTVQDDTWLND